MSTKAVNQALARLRAALPRSGADVGPDPVEDLLTLINAAIEHHEHKQYMGTPRPGYPTTVSGSDGEPTRHVCGPECADEPSGATETRPRPGKAVSSPEQVLYRVQEALETAGVPGYAPLSVDQGVNELVRLLRLTQEQLAIAQASARQHLEASSHRAQIAEHYRYALDSLVVMTTKHAQSGHDQLGMLRTAVALAVKALDHAPEWDKRIRP